MANFDNNMIYLLTGLATLVVFMTVTLSSILGPTKSLISPYAVQHYTQDGGLIENYPMAK